MHISSRLLERGCGLRVIRFVGVSVVCPPDGVTDGGSGIGRDRCGLWGRLDFVERPLNRPVVSNDRRSLFRFIYCVYKFEGTGSVAANIQVPRAAVDSYMHEGFLDGEIDPGMGLHCVGCKHIRRYSIGESRGELVSTTDVL